MNVNLKINQIEEKFNLKFNSHNQKKLFFEMFNELLESRVTIVRITSKGRGTLRPVTSSPKRYIVRMKREVKPFDIEICLAALCMLNWPGKSAEYKQQIEEIKNLYYNNFVTRKLILNSLKNNVSTKFKNIQTKNAVYFLNLNDLIV